MSVSKIKGIIFDLDGTLANTIYDLQTGMNTMLRKNGLKECTIDELLAGINRGAREFVRSSVGPENVTSEEYLTERYKEYSEAYGQHCNEKTVLYDTVAEAVYKLKAEGYKLAVLSNKQDKYTKLIVNTLFKEGTFDVVLGHIDGGFPHKPNPASTEYLLSLLGVTKDEVLFVGDSNVDIETSINAGIYPVGVCWGYRSPEFLKECGAKKILSSMLELFDIIEELG